MFDLMKDPPLFAVGPIRKAAILMRCASAVEWIEHPKLFACGGVKSHHVQFRGGCVENSIDYDRRTLNTRSWIGIAAVERPCNFQILHVAGIDLRKR